jgi:hypothetical protein
MLVERRAHSPANRWQLLTRKTLKVFSDWSKKIRPGLQKLLVVKLAASRPRHI